MNASNIRIYKQNEVVSFRKTNEEWGGLSNMAPGFPIVLNGIVIRNSEVLYQSLRFPYYSDIQREIMAETSPMTAKMKSKKYLSLSRPDWNRVRVSAMRWALRAKLACNFQNFSQLLFKTGNNPIVEHSTKDDFWGAYLKDGVFIGQNVLGRLLMELREEIRTIDNYNLPKPKFEKAVILNKDFSCNTFINQKTAASIEER